jgi:hypothetical protein
MLLIRKYKVKKEKENKEKILVLIVQLQVLLARVWTTMYNVVLPQKMVQCTITTL